jgi:hypothetical protein
LEVLLAHSTGSRRSGPGTKTSGLRAGAVSEPPSGAALMHLEAELSLGSRDGRQRALREGAVVLDVQVAHLWFYLFLQILHDLVV